MKKNFNIIFNYEQENLTLQIHMRMNDLSPESSYWKKIVMGLNLIFLKVYIMSISSMLLTIMFRK